MSASKSRMRPTLPLRFLRQPPVFPCRHRRPCPHRPPRRRRRLLPRTSAGPGEVRSPLAGRIIAINVQPGQEVKEGDHVVTVEAMKMNTAVTAPKAGKVAEILTTVGSAVDEGQILLRIAN